jgi:ArsR family transcriptional regulator
MRHKGILKSRRSGVNIFYSLANKKVVKACMLMREVLLEQMDKQRKLLSGAKK